ncbi:hypothetical protein MA16_Dca019199 [Dendrobium catenatum]|uniref:Integrase zinc-binding domain-containing protein n=1 Tax=Dendrobium catenatum TaxID=906689 RepID=A0A2I0WKD0_9ASPA|nr:hypothetical protein MA16_Dca019199 [Dendrobium catenatum]
MKVKGEIADREVVVLIDSGPIHNFISTQIVELLGMELVDTGGYGVMMGTGKVEMGRRVCRVVVLKIQGYGYCIEGERLLYQGRFVMPRTSIHIPHLLQEFYGSAVGGHSGIHKTYRRLAAELYWKGMHKDVEEMMAMCAKETNT